MLLWNVLSENFRLWFDVIFFAAVLSTSSEAQITSWLNMASVLIKSGIVKLKLFSEFFKWGCLVEEIYLFVRTLNSLEPCLFFFQVFPWVFGREIIAPSVDYKPGLNYMGLIGTSSERTAWESAPISEFIWSSFRLSVVVPEKVCLNFEFIKFVSRAGFLLF